MSELELRGVQSDEELRLANDLMAKVHMRDYFDACHWMETSGAGYPGFAREHTRIGIWQGEIAGALRITTDTIRLGEARLKMGGFGWVTTSGRHRHKGIARELIRDTLRYLREHNYHVSMLFGIPNFYGKFGFVTALADYASLVDVLEAANAEQGPYRIRAGKPGDIQAIQKIHNAHEQEVPCSLVRSRSHLINRWEQWKAVQVLTDAQGKLVAYFLPRRTDADLTLEEVGVLDWSACGPLLRACAEMAMEHYLPRLRFLAPPSHPFVRYLLQYKSTHEMKIQRDAGGMMAFVNTGEALESMIPEWEQQVQQSAARNHHTEVTLYVDRAPYRIRSHHGAIDIATSPGRNKVSLDAGELMQALTGYRDIEDVLASERRIITAEGRELLKAIFPRRTPFVWAPDHF